MTKQKATPRGRLAIVGAGVIGLSCAWRAAEAGWSVELIDPAPGSGSSWVAGGMLAPVTEAWPGEEELLELGSESLGRWPEFATALAQAADAPAGLRTEGTVVVAAAAGDRAELDDLANYLGRLGRDVSVLSARELRRLEPSIGPDVRGGLSVPGDLAVDNRVLLAALLAAADRAGVRFVEAWATRVAADGVQLAAGAERTGAEWAGAERTGAERAGAGWAGAERAGAGWAGAERTGAERTGAGWAAAERAGAGWAGADRTGAGSGERGGTGRAELAGGRWIEADAVLIAAGAHSAGLHAGLDGLVRPVKGEILRLRHRVGALPPPSRTVRAVVDGRPVYAVPRDGGGLVIGATQYETGFDTEPTVGGVRDLLRDAERVLPGVAEYALVEAAAGLRPGTPDNLPLIGSLAGGPPGSGAVAGGPLVATGHGRNGMLLAPITAAAVLAMLSGEPGPPAVAVADPARLTRAALGPATPTDPAASADPAALTGPTARR